jgi:AcrR family transcriptional regulator
MVTAVSNRRNRRREETERRIVNAAVSLLQKHPMSEITVEQITEAADVGKGTFFNYFASKDQMIVTAARIKREELQAMLSKAAEVEDIRAFLSDFTHRFLEQPRRTPTLIRNLFGSALTGSAALPFQATLMAFRQALTVLIQNGQRRSQIRTDITAEKLAAAFQQCLFGTQAIWALEPEPDDIHKRVELILEIFWQGVAQPKSGRKSRGK